jgi:hypothetical protein
MSMRRPPSGGLDFFRRLRDPHGKRTVSEGAGVICAGVAFPGYRR